MTTFKTALSLCGMTQSEAADFLGVRLDTVKSWCSDQNPKSPPEHAWRLLASLFQQIQDAADGAADTMALDGIDPRAYNMIEADIPGNELPTSAALKAAGAMALLMAIEDSEV